MTTVTLDQLLRAEPALARIGAQTRTLGEDGKDHRVPAKTIYALARLLGWVQQQTTQCETTQNQLIKDLGEKGEGETWTLAPTHPNLPIYLKEITALHATEVAITEWLLTEALLATVEISANDRLLLAPLLQPDPPSEGA